MFNRFLNVCFRRPDLVFAMICSHGGFLRFIFSMMFFFFDLFLEKKLFDGLGNVLKIWWVIVNGIVSYFFLEIAESHLKLLVGIDEI